MLAQCKIKMDAWPTQTKLAVLFMQSSNIVIFLAVHFSPLEGVKAATLFNCRSHHKIRETIK